MAQTMEQKRAADVWRVASQGVAPDMLEAYGKLAKGLPALIMNSGLMQVLAFLNEKGEGGRGPQAHCDLLGRHLRSWLAERFPRELSNADFATFMQALMKAEPQRFQDITTEAFAWLRWMRQMAPAISAGGK